MARQAGTRRRGTRRIDREARAARTLAQLPWRTIRNPYRPVEIVDAERLERIHDASLRILEEIGIEILLPEAAAIMRTAGADVSADGHKVRFDRALIAECIATAPARFTVHARNPQRNLEVGGDAVNFCAMSSAPNVSDIDGGRRPGNREDFRNLLKIGHSLNIIHLWGGYPVEPLDIHPSVRHLECLFDHIAMSDKAYHAYSLGYERNLDAIEMTRIARGIDDAQLDREPSLLTIINANSPLKFDATMLRGIIEMASRNQVVVITPFTLAGAMAPVTLAGALAQQNAEALAGVAFSQMVRPGAPAIYGAFTSNVDMRTGAPAFGTPEYTKAAMVGGQLARRYRLPYRSSNVNASNAVDVQAAYESQMALWGAIMGGAQMIKHAAGWLEGGLTTSYEKLIVDAEMLQGMAEFMSGLEVDDGSLALDAIADVGPGGHFFGTAHTQARYETAFYAPFLSDWRNYETWVDAGAASATIRANKIARQLIADYQPPPLDPAIREELEAFVARRKREGGAPTDF